jgi:hypothetical protein
MQDRLVRWSLVAVVAGVLAVAVVVSAAAAAFDEAFLAGVAATVIGLAIGIPATYVVGRIAADADRRARKRELLRAILQELQENETDLHRRIQDDQRGVVLPALSIEVWQAISNSGDLRHLQDVELLAEIARAYSHVAKTRFLEEQALRTMTSDGTFQPQPVKMLRATDEGTAMFLSVASGAVAHALQLLGAPSPPAPDSLAAQSRRVSREGRSAEPGERD